ncbi:MAG: two-component system sensor histidine kinase CreC [Cellvibrio sp. 79]|nr:MAG: two-component system sensor histidine kinase CreC [Cellvibrio sp. 79]
MSLSARIFIVYLIFVAFCSYFVLRTVMDEIRPGVRQSTEETLVDTANLLAEFLREPLLENQLQSPRIREILKAYGQRQPNANIWGVNKLQVNHRIYVTDNKGIVLLDSSDIAAGQDYSRWNDVHLTLQGKYGARSTQETLGDESSSIMYVAAPIMHAGKIIGVVSVAKPNRSLQPYIDRTQRRLGLLGAGLILSGLISGAVFSWWFSRELRRLREYALNVSQGQRAILTPGLIHSGELGQLAKALESMRNQLDGKTYIEQYVQTLTHELKSPLAGIRAASELLQSPMSESQQQKFLANIESESLRLQQLIERLLNLALVEQQQSLQAPHNMSLKPLIESLVDTRSARIARKDIRLQLTLDNDAEIYGEKFLIEQALLNLIDNALDFTPAGGTIQIITLLTDETCTITVINQGEPVPDFAVPRLTERFFSLPRPDTGRKSTGLGLSFVQEVMKLHQGELQLQNTQDGVSASLRFPR